MRRPGRHSILALLGVSAAAALMLPLYASAGPGPAPQAPDLRADPVELIDPPAVYTQAETEGGLGTGRLLVRFNGFVTNIGAGPLEVSGNPQVPGNVVQRARTASNQAPSVVVGTPEVRFEAVDSHNHFHLMRAMEYSLWTLDKTTQVAPGQKVGFCLYDIEAAPQPAPAQDGLPNGVYTGDVTEFCDSGHPESTALKMGTSRGWRDVYGKDLAFQWVDVSNTAPGTYLVGSQADPGNTIWEGGGAGEVNPPTFADSAPVTVPGWVAQPVAVPQTGTPKAIPITALRYGGLPDSDLRYRIVTAPSHGILSVAAGQTFDPATQALLYTPPGSYRGPDAFQYVAVSAGSGFPLSPPIAAVALTETRPSVTISGAPARLETGASVRLTAALANVTGGVRWSTTGGRIGTAGLLTAPATVPPGRAITVRATSTAKPAVRGQVRITIVPRPTAARPGTGQRLSAGSRLLSRLAVRRISRRIFVAQVATGRKAGRATMTATVARTVVGRCRARVRARQTFSCKVRLARPYPLTKVRVTAHLVAGKTVTVRRTFVVAPRRRG